MRFTIATIATMVAAATASAIPRASDIGAWNVTISSTSGSDRARTETVTGLYANSQLADNIPVNCHFQGMLNGEVLNKLTCDPESFRYEFESVEENSADGEYQYKLTLSQTVVLSGTNVTVKGVSEPFGRTCDTITGKNCYSSDILITATTAVA